LTTRISPPWTLIIAFAMNVARLGTNDRDSRPARAAYAAADCPPSPVVGNARVSASARVAAAATSASPRSVTDPVGLWASFLISTRSTPSSSANLGGLDQGRAALAHPVGDER